jgi:hypothetical protein
MCQACDTDEPIPDDTVSEDIDFNSTSWNEPLQGKLSELAHEKARQVVDLAGFLSGCGGRI